MNITDVLFKAACLAARAHDDEARDILMLASVELDALNRPVCEFGEFHDDSVVKELRHQVMQLKIENMRLKDLALTNARAVEALAHECYAPA